MVSYEYTVAVMELFRLEKAEDLNSTQRLLLITLASYANEDGDCWPSQVKLAKVTALSRVTVNTHLKKLCELGYIESQKRMNASGDLDTCLYSIKIDLGQTTKKRRPKVVPIQRAKKTTRERLEHDFMADEA